MFFRTWSFNFLFRLDIRIRVHEWKQRTRAAKQIDLFNFLCILYREISVFIQCTIAHAINLRNISLKGENTQPLLLQCNVIAFLYYHVSRHRSIVCRMSACFYFFIFSNCFILLWYQLILNVARFEWQNRFTMDFHIFHYQGSSRQTFIFLPFVLGRIEWKLLQLQTFRRMGALSALDADGVERIAHRCYIFIPYHRNSR